MAARQGAVERGVLADLRSIPAYLRDGGQAKAALRIARLIDQDQQPKDVASLARELRALLTGILAEAPREGEQDAVDDISDELAARRAAAAGH